VLDTPELWAFWRHQASGTQKSIVMIGTSRLEAGVSVQVFKEQCPDYRIIQLSVAGDKSPIGTLEDLAADTGFRGIVLCDFETPFLIRARWCDQADYYAAELTPAHLSESCVGAVVQSVLTNCQRDLSLKNQWSRLVRGEWRPKRQFCRQTIERELRYNFSNGGDLEQMRQSIFGEMRAKYESTPLPAPKDLCENLPLIDSMVAEIRARGGDVVFLRMPSSGARFSLEEEFHSKAQYWERFAAATKARCLHFRDVPTLRDFKCPDESHLDWSMARPFTIALVAELRRIGVIGLPTTTHN
jgi:hypothetical protein